MGKNFMKSLFLILFSLIPLLANSEIRVAKDSTTGMKTISSVVSNSENLITEIIFRASSEGKYWLELSKIDKKCWFFEGQLKFAFTNKNISVVKKFQATEINNYIKNNELCTTRAVFNVTKSVNRMTEMHSVFVLADFKDKSQIKWELPKNILDEWKAVIELKNLEDINKGLISQDTIDSTYTDGEYLIITCGLIDVDEEPRLIKFEQPEYPLKALRDKTEGKVVVAVLVDKNGKVRDARIAQSSGTDVGFEEAALKAAFKNVYKPAIQNNKPTAIWIYYPVNFVLEKKSPSKNK